MRRAAARTPAVSRGTRGRPSYSWPPSSMKTSQRTIAPRSSGQSTNGSSEALAGSPIRIAATGVRSRRCTTALVKCVVPIMTAVTGAARPALLVGGLPSTLPRASATGAARPALSEVMSIRRARATPVVTSGVVGVFTARTTRRFSSRTASVLVPPTSTPMRVAGAGAARPPPDVGGLRLGTRGSEDRVEVEIVAERARAHVLEPLRRQEHGRCGQRDHADALAVAERLGTDRLPRDGIHHADQVGRRHARHPVEPADRELVLEREIERAATELVEPVDGRRAP